MGVQRINPDGLYRPPGYSHVVEARGGRTVYIAGQVATDPSGALVGEGDVRAQAEQVFANLATALAAVGMDFRNVVKLTVFLADIADLAVFREVRDLNLPPGEAPASTLVQARMVHSEMLIEIEAIAVGD